MRALIIALVSIAAAKAQFTEWSAPAKVEGLVNTPAPENCVSVSKNGLTMYFARLMPSTTSASSGLYDLFVSKRASVKEPWGLPALVPNLNSDSNDFCPALSLDEYRLYFASARPGGCGDGFTDIYVSRRHDQNDDFGWGPPENLGCDVNSPQGDQAPSFYEDDTGTVVMYFASNRVASQGWDIYQTRMRDDGTFGPATPVAELNTAVFDERGTAMRRDGLEIILDSTRPGGLGNRDLWVATRASTMVPWSPLLNLTKLNSPTFDGGRMSMSYDGTALYFASDRGDPGNNDIYVTTRERLTPDLNGDGVINCDDLNIVRSSFGKKAGEPGFDTRADVTQDGVVDIRDIALVAQRLPLGPQCQ